MTATNDHDICPVFQSLITLRDSINALSCAADLIPEDFDDSGFAIAMLFKRLSERLESDLTTLLTSYHQANASQP